MANYETDPEILKPFLPYKTGIDLWNNTCYLSLVGFMFLNTKVKGIKFPFHTNFEEVNLRFYVRYKDNDEWKRGVVFIKEIVPRPVLTFIANTVYKENYETMTMSHNWESNNGMQTVEYKWKKGNKWNIFKVNAGTELIDISNGSEEEFITEHFWGYTKISSEKTSEYGVEHPRWQVYSIKNYTIDVDFKSVYGQNFEFLNNLKPKSVFLAEGSEIKVKSGRII
ncbi:MAG: DUF2071 domain-containing protein [Ignavibacteria bacterium]|nr:DUF2071 domain-containing protein [Ignavibacteria bacterium]